MRVSVVLPILIKNLYHATMTQRCVALARGMTRVPFELIIVESGSEYFLDDADIYIHEKKVTTPEIAHNLGFRVACRNNFIVLLTNDTFVTDNWLEALIDTFDKKPDCGFATLGSSHQKHIQQNKIEEGYWFDVAMIRREVFEKVGFYDERFNGSFPDTDLLVRAYKEGWKMYRNYNCIVDIASTQTTVGLNPKHAENYTRGRELFRQKHDGCNLEIYEAVK